MVRLREAQRSEPTGATPGTLASRNPGTPLDLAWVRSPCVNRQPVERRTDMLPRRRPVKHEWQAASLLRAITCIDLTTTAWTESGMSAQPRASAARPKHEAHVDDGSGGARLV